MPVGDVISAAGFGTTENPVMAPPALRLTSAVACCHQGFLTDGNKLTSFPDHTAAVAREWMNGFVTLAVLNSADA
ncbi:MAG TPA: hypothetical protein VKD26_00325 [Streptosporangiaceae bacterium]|nr:hypothetical protein [Streptosporangiaceae bacterium]